MKLLAASRAGTPRGAANPRAGERVRPPGTRMVRAGAVALVVVVAGWAAYAAISGNGGGLNPVDLTVYRDGGLIVRHVRPYYDPHAYDPLYAWGGYTKLALKFTYTPFAAVAFALVSFIPWTALWIVSVLGNIAALGAALWFAFGALGYRGRRRLRLGATLVAAAATFWLQPVVRTIELGQVNLVLMAVIIGDLCQPDTTAAGRPRWWKGLATGVAAGIKLIPLIFVPYLLVTRKFRQAAAVVAGFAATVAIGFAVVPHDSSRWWLHGLILGDGNRTGFMGWAGNQSLRALTTRLAGSVAAGQDPWLAACAVAVIAGLTAAWLLERAGYHLVAILATALTGLLVSPVSWDHHWVWIAVGCATAGHYAVTAGSARPSALANGAARAGARRAARLCWLLAGGMVFLYAAWPDAIWENERNLGRFSFGLLWAQPNTNPAKFAAHGDQPWYPEYHWHGFQLLWGNAYIIGGLALLVVLLVLGWRSRSRPPRAEDATRPSLPATAGVTGIPNGPA